MNLMLMSVFRSCIVIFLLCVGVFGGALYFQLGLGYTPCPLCELQRLAYLLVGLVALLALVHRPKKNWAWGIYSALMAIVSLLGLFVASRQLFLQHLPPGRTPACGAGLNQLLKMLPLDKVLIVIFKGTGDCALVQWRFLGLSLAGYSALGFVLILLLLLWGTLTLTRKPGHVA